MQCPGFHASLVWKGSNLRPLNVCSTGPGCLCFKNIVLLILWINRVCHWQALSTVSNICQYGQIPPTLQCPATRLGLLALPTNIKLGCTGLPGRNTLAYQLLTILIALTPGANLIDIFTAVIYGFS
jgi:hypothetical protein